MIYGRILVFVFLNFNVVTYCLEKMLDVPGVVLYCHPGIFTRNFTNNFSFLNGDFTGVLLMNFIPVWEAEIVN